MICKKRRFEDSYINKALRIIIDMQKKKYMFAREYELREPISHIELCTYHEPFHLFWNVTGLARSSRLSRHKNVKLAESVGKEVHLTFVDKDDDLVLENTANIKE